MNIGFNAELLARMVREKRGTTGLRDAANEIGDISAPTLSRIEKGKIPDVDTFIQVCGWLGVSSDTFINSSASEMQGKQKLVAHLRAEKELDPDTVEMLLKVIDLAYRK
jgi:transcriptional regulator with XRE-family HTH domain